MSKSPKINIGPVEAETDIIRSISLIVKIFIYETRLAKSRVGEHLKSANIFNLDQQRIRIRNSE